MDKFADCTMRGVRSTTKLYKQKDVQGTRVCRNDCEVLLCYIIFIYFLFVSYIRVQEGGFFMKMIFIPKYLIQAVLLFLICLLAGGVVWNVVSPANDSFYAEPTMMEPVYCGTTKENCVALAINVDWGEDVLPDMLDTLAEEDAQATFFITGRFAEQFPEIVAQIAEAGHEVGNHGYAHPHPDQLTVEQNKEDITKAEQVLEPLIGVKPMLYAPPYGEQGETVLTAAEQCGYTTILWTADTIDWEQPAPSHEVLIQRVTGDKLQKGAILLMHPKVHTAEALEDIIETIRGKGYTCVKVSDVL